MLRLLVAIWALFLWPTVARAEWREAVTDHFIIYSSGTEPTLRAAARDLERFDFLLRFMTGVPLDKPALVKPKIYLMIDTKAVADTMYGGGGGVAGYYDASARGPIIVGTRNPTGAEDYDISGQEVLFHEYAHHFMFQHFPAAYPVWYSEGFAEYYGATRLLPNDVVEVGHGAGHRYFSFEYNRWIPLKQLLVADSYSDFKFDADLIYAQGWLLVHYLAADKARSQQLRVYLDAINRGQGYDKARDQAFGADAKALDRGLRAYSRRTRLDAVRLPFKPIDLGSVAVRTLGAAESALLYADIGLGRGLLAREAAGFAESVRRTAARFPRDSHALRLLAEAERLAGNYAAAAAATGRLLALDPKSPRGLMLRGQLAVDSLASVKSTDGAAWDAARKMLSDAHRASPRDAMILEAYYDAFAAQGVLPPPGAQNAIYRAVELVPQDGVLRYKLAADYEARNMIREAIAIIKPAAYDAHADSEEPKNKAKRERDAERYRLAGRRRTETPREMLSRLEAKLTETAATAGKR